MAFRIFGFFYPYWPFLTAFLAYQGSKWGSKKFFQRNAPWDVVSCGKKFFVEIRTFEGYFGQFYPKFGQKTRFWPFLAVLGPLEVTEWKNYGHIKHQSKDFDEIFTMMYDMIYEKLQPAGYWAKITPKRGKNDRDEPPCHLETGQKSGML